DRQIVLRDVRRGEERRFADGERAEVGDLELPVELLRREPDAEIDEVSHVELLRVGKELLNLTSGRVLRVVGSRVTAPARDGADAESEKSEGRVNETHGATSAIHGGCNVRTTPTSAPFRSAPSQISTTSPRRSRRPHATGVSLAH